MTGGLTLVLAPVGKWGYSLGPGPWPLLVYGGMGETQESVSESV